MTGVILREWAGTPRPFALKFGQQMDLEEACGKVGFGAIYLRIGAHQYFSNDVYHIIRLGLIGGGMSAVEAERLTKDRFDLVPMSGRVELALDILLSVMEGISPTDDVDTGDPAKPMDTGAIFASLINVGMSPDQVRSMRYADFVNMTRSMSGKGPAAPSEDEFAEMLQRFGESST